MASPNQSAANRTGRPALDRALEAFDAFEHRLMSLHAPEFAALDITMAQAKLLYVVTAAGELTMSEIAHRLGVTISTASGAVEHLVAIGLLARHDDPANRRQVRVSVTPDGRDALEQLRELSRRHLRALFDLLGDTDLAVVDRAIRILTDAADRAAPSPSEPAGATR
jgi:DNA-binding MarR family transcriptional regulator